MDMGVMGIFTPPNPKVCEASSEDIAVLHTSDCINFIESAIDPGPVSINISCLTSSVPSLSSCSSLSYFSASTQLAFYVHF